MAGGNFSSFLEKREGGTGTEGVPHKQAAVRRRECLSFQIPLRVALRAVETANGTWVDVNKIYNCFSHEL